MFNTRLETVLSYIHNNGFTIKGVYSILQDKATNQVYGSELVLERDSDKEIVHGFAPVKPITIKGERVPVVVHCDNNTPQLIVKPLAEMKDAEFINGNAVI